ncbi:sensor histidine kinase [Paenibacillus sp. y28]|uniref:sensor histidine kinase n=1 Tax=Paenibacillus sp. y28 TaxID=3129110 RepID=UPI003019B8B3
MKLRLKLPLLFLSIMILLFLMLLFYVRTFLLGQIFDETHEWQRENRRQESIMVEKVRQLYPDKEAVGVYLNDRAKEWGMEVQLLDPEDRTILFKTDTNVQAKLYSRYQLPIFIDDDVVWELAVEYPMKITQYNKHFFIGIVIAVICFILLAFIRLTIYVHHLIAKPLGDLNQYLDKINLYRYRPSSKLLSHYARRRDEIGELYRKVRRMEERLQMAQREQTEMVAAISHDLKTPMTVLYGYLEMMTVNQSMTEEQRQEYLQIMGNKLVSMKHLLDEFTAYTKQELQNSELPKKAVHAAEFVESLCREYELELEGLGYRLLWSHQLPSDAVAFINDQMIRRLFANLLSNSVIYGQNPGLNLFISARLHEGGLEMNVEDNGVGVPEGELAIIFQKFYRVEKSRHRQKGGTGLGLSIAKSIVEQHGGSIQAFSSIHGGLGIRFWLPLK